VIYCAPTVAAREWKVPLDHRALFLEGPTLSTRRLLHHDYPLTFGIVPLLARERFDCIVVAGWSLFASQVAVAWARLRRVPYVLTSESHTLDARPAWVRVLKRTVIPRVVRPASGWLVTGSLARDALVAYGADPARVRVFANTVDVEAHAARVEALRSQRRDWRVQFGVAPDEVAVLSAARLDRIKGLDVLMHSAAGIDGIRLILAGSGPDEGPLRALAAKLGVAATFTGFVGPTQLEAAYAAADVFALVSRSEPWGVVVVEAAAASLPLLLSDRVGAAADLLRPGENGELVSSEDVEMTAAALRRLAVDSDLRTRYGVHSRALAADWGYEPSVAAFADAVRGAVAR
jgi:glycosyltransferase involved in cell wall biosynthesis